MLSNDLLIATGARAGRFVKRDPAFILCVKRATAFSLASIAEVWY